jgi:tRNA1(Val) A37 N6-methylase TrmN6
MEYEVFTLAGSLPIKLFISKNHRFGTDSLLLGEFSSNIKHKTVVDLCSGCGIIPVMLQNAKKVFAVELQKEAAELIRRTVAENGLDNIEVVHKDLREISLPREGADLVTANPPYYSGGYVRESQKTARHEITCTLDDVVKSAERLLKFGGELKMCMTTSRLAETIGIMQKYAVEPKEIMLIPGKNKVARLFLVSGKKGGKPGVKITWK